VVFELLKVSTAPVDTTTIATEIGYPTTTTRRACEDLTAHSVVERRPAATARPTCGC
jgi:DNA-binding IclR family transcriptional regulator